MKSLKQYKDEYEGFMEEERRLAAMGRGRDYSKLGIPGCENGVPMGVWITLKWEADENLYPWSPNYIDRVNAAEPELRDFLMKRVRMRKIG